MIELAVTLLVVLLLGALLDRALLGAPGSGPIEHTGRALMLGLGAAGALSALLDTALSGFGGPAVSAASLGLLFLAVAAVLVVLAVRRRPVPRPRNPLPSGRPGERIAHALLLLMAAWGLFLPLRSGWLRPTFQFDALVRWMFKTRVLHFDGTLLGPVSTDPAFALTHQRYPPLVSHVAHLPAAIGRVLSPERFSDVVFDDRITSAVFPLFAVALVAVVYGALARRTGRLTAALGAAWLAHLPLLSYQLNNPPGAGAFSAMADIPLGLFLAGAALAAVDAASGRPRALLEAGLLLGFATLTKNEGLPAVAGLALGLLLAGGAGRWRRAGAVAGLGLLLYLVVWGSAIVLHDIPATDEDYVGQAGRGWEPVAAGLARLSIVLPELGRELVDVRSWNLTWPAAAVLLVAGGAAAVRRPAVRLLLAVFLVQLLSYVYAYVITRWSSPAAEMLIEVNDDLDDPVAFLMTLTLGRLLMQVVPLVICAGLMAAPLERPAAPRGAAEPAGSG